MTERTLAWLKNEWLSRDPKDWMTDLLDSVPALTGAPQILVTSVSQGDSSPIALGTVPALSVIVAVYVVRTTAWDGAPSLEVGKSGDADWLVTNAEANLTGAIPSGEEQDVEVCVDAKAVDTATAIIVTYSDGAATQGAGYVVLQYIEEVAGG